MARKICNVCNKRAVGTTGEDPKSAGMNDLCGLCYDEGGWENTHSDGAHDTILHMISQGNDLPEWAEQEKDWMDGCWFCHPELNQAQNWKPKAKPVAKATKEPVFRRTQLNHKDMCTHAQTPKARRTCKNAFWAGVQAMVTTGGLTEDQAWEHCIKALQTPAKKPTKFTVAPKGHVGVGNTSLKTLKDNGPLVLLALDPNDNEGGPT